MDDEPSLRLGILWLNVLGRELPDSRDYWDGNWLSVEVRCETGNAQVRWSGPLIRNTELEKFREQLLSLRSGTLTMAELKPLEPTVHVLVMPAKSGAVTGHFTTRIELADDTRSEVHSFECTVDQSDLQLAADQIAVVMREFPVRN